jgi:hypothetical protein
MGVRHRLSGIRLASTSRSASIAGAITRTMIGLPNLFRPTLTVQRTWSGNTELMVDRN